MKYLFCLFFAWFFPLLGNVELLTPVVVSKLPHHLPAFTQGLSIDDDQLFESTGLYGQSSLRRIDILTGEIKQEKKLPSSFFAEGIAVCSNRIYQLTWKEQTGFIYDRQSFQVLQVFNYQGEGWGLCCDGETLWMSDGSSRLFQRDKKNFGALKILDVHLENTPILFLNDLSCVGDHLYANVWQTNEIVRINKETGEVTGMIDASHLLSPKEKAKLDSSEVLNGIAYRPKTGTFLITGKGWPWIFEVRFIVL